MGTLLCIHISGLETTAYAYNIQSWPTKMQGAKFTEQLAYNEAVNGLTPSTPQWSGRISAMRWFRGNPNIKPAYQFTYDGTGRLTEATYTQNMYLQNRRPKYTETYSYDSMGNITALTRQGWLYNTTWGLIDDLTMTYDGNRLVKCDDAVSAQPTNNGAHHFQDLADEDVEYGYDRNGNMTEDLNRNITSVEYNTLNLPKQISFSDLTKMRFTYDAAGNKLRAEYWTIPTFNPGGPIGPAALGGGAEPQGGGIVGPILPPINQNDPQVVTDYCGNLIYRNDTLSMLLTEEGYVTFDERGEPLYHYYLKDHLGSVRVVLDGDGTVEQVNDYYPSGTLMYTSTNGTVQPYKFGQKELERTLPLDEYDFGARWMDPVVGGRFTTMDPLCEKYYSISPYAYCGNNPVNAVDPDGKKILFVNGYWASGLIGRLIGSSQSGKSYWGTGFDVAAQNFFHDWSSINNSNYIDGSSLFGCDMSGSDRFVAGVIYAQQHMAELTKGLSENEAFNMVTHSEGSAYGAGIAQYLLSQGYKVNTILHLSADEGDEFETPQSPFTIQLSYENDWVTGNHIMKNTDVYGFIDSGDLNLFQIHGSTKNSSVFKAAEDLLSVRIMPIIGELNGRFYYGEEQIKGSTKYNTIFKVVNGHVLDIRY